ncbi:MAG: hypothetical protein ACSHXB_18845 [Sulfitobacter sp.]
MKFSIHFFLGILLPFAAFAQNSLLPTAQSASAIDHPYSVLGVIPGARKDEAAQLLSSHFKRDLADEVVALNVRSRDGRSFQYEYAQRLVSPWVTPFVRMGSEPYEDVNVILATGVLEGRVLGIDRTIVATGSDRPSAEAVFRQIEESFGAPSLVHLDGYKSELIYAYAHGAFIPDLKAADPTPNAAGVGSSDYLSNDTPCKTVIGRSPIYQYRSPGGDDWIGDCDLIFRVLVESGGAKTTIRFSLNDYALARVNRDETDRQINEALEQPQPASEIKL